MQSYRLIGHRLSSVHRAFVSSLNVKNGLSSRSFSDKVTIDDSTSSSSSSNDEQQNSSINKTGTSFDGFIKHVQAVQQSLAHSTPPKSDDHLSNKDEPDNRSFATLLRSSRLMQWGDFNQGIVTTGKITHVMGDDLYIDFGGKFQCVCRRPSKQAERFVRNAKVKLRVNDLELSTRFLGSDTDMTLLEADGQILQLVDSPVHQTVKDERDVSISATSV